MNFRHLFLRFALLVLVVATLAAKKPDRAPKPDDDYQPGPDSLRQAGVPVGKTFQFKFAESKVFPETTRTITVYIPAQYKADKPACLFVGFDGLKYESPIVFDNLIHKREMPVTIGVGIGPGQVESASGVENPRFNRSMEFDGLNDSLARCVLDEILPAVERQKTPDRLPILLSKNPDDRCTAGGSTGAIAAFTVAWERPDAFHRVFTSIGTFVGMRGGDRYPVLVRKTEPKPLRLFMQDGSNDQWMGGPEVGDWWMSNQALERALKFSGYTVEHVWGTGSHSAKHATAIFPDAMRSLWKDWPEPIKAGETQNTFLKAILAPGETWTLVQNAPANVTAVGTDLQGEIYYLNGAVRKLAKHGEVEAAQSTIAASGFAFGPDARMYQSDSRAGSIAIFGKAGEAPHRITDVKADHLIVTHAGLIYATETGATEVDGKVWLMKPTGEKLVIDSGLNHPTGIAISPDGLWLAVLENKTHGGFSYRVQPDGTVDAKQRFYWLHVPDTADDSGVENICFDRDGRLYAATRMGVQVLDRNGRSRAVLPLPLPSTQGQAIGICFGGKDFDTLYVSAGGNVYARNLKSHGAPAWEKPMKLPPWSAG